MEWTTLGTVLPTTVSAALYALVQATFVASMCRRRPARAARASPPVTLLKPIAGADEGLAENLESFARLAYPGYELLFGFASRTDPALPIVRAFLASHPELDARIVWTDPRAAENPKVAQLIGLTRAAKHAIVVVSDSNVRVGPGYLRAVVDRLLDPGVGLVSNLVVGTDDASFGAAVENAQLTTFIAPSVAAAQVLAGRAITVGKSMAMRRDDLARVGGWTSVGDVLAEDDVLGRRFDAAGLGVAVSLEPVRNPNVACSIGRTIERHTRWAKMRRTISPRTFPLEPFLSPSIIAALVAVVAPSVLALEAWALACVLQCSGALLALRLLHGRFPKPSFFLVEIARAHVAFACWILACSSRNVVWRGKPFRLGPGSKLVSPRTARTMHALPSARLAPFPVVAPPQPSEEGESLGG
jgi:ceramide glucosyltransferase